VRRAIRASIENTMRTFSEPIMNHEKRYTENQLEQRNSELIKAKAYRLFGKLIFDLLLYFEIPALPLQVFH
jgi:hypothetical protein